MKLETVAAVIGLICFAAYFVGRLGLADLPGIPTDYSAVGMIALAAMLVAQRTQGMREVRGVDG